VVDKTRQTLFVSTGNGYSIPTAQAYVDCINAGGDDDACESIDAHTDSIVALDLGTGAIKWATQLMRDDNWNVACFSAGVNCPHNAGPDADFASGVNEVTFNRKHAGRTTIVGAGQKNGVYTALDPDTGKIVWSTQVGPGSTLGGMEWGSASDGNRIYVAIANFFGIPYGATGSNFGGSWSALDPADGTILWQTPDPNGAIDLGPVTVSNGVVYGGSMSATGNNMVALDAAGGNILWGFASGGSVIAGAVVSGGTVYWGSGYSNLPIPGFVGNNQFYAFAPGGGS
jgi:polyvinyl alcohol dehydrogenase (cytochrome)